MKQLNMKTIYLSEKSGKAKYLAPAHFLTTLRLISMLLRTQLDSLKSWVS